MPIDLKQPGMIKPVINDFVDLWLRGFEAVKLTNTYALESGMSPEDAFQVYVSQVPLVELINEEGNGKKSLSKLTGLPEIQIFNSEKRKVFLHDFGNWNFVYVGAKKSSPQEWFSGYHGAGSFSLHPTIYSLVGALKTAYVKERAANDLRFHNDLPFNLMLADSSMYEPFQNILGNIVSNSVKYSIPGGNVDIRLEGKERLIFSDDGIGMKPGFASMLGRGQAMREERAKDVEGSGIGWQSIANSANQLGWSWEIITTPHKGTNVIFNLNPGDMVEMNGSKVGMMASSFKQPAFSAADILAGASMFAGAEPFAGYVKAGDMIDVKGSPIFAAIKQARQLADRMGLAEVDPSEKLPSGLGIVPSAIFGTVPLFPDQGKQMVSAAKLVTGNVPLSGAVGLVAQQSQGKSGITGSPAMKALMSEVKKAELEIKGERDRREK